MKRSTQKLMSGISAAVISISAVNISDVSITNSAFATEGIAIYETNFPDENFRNYVFDKCDSNGDGFLSSSEISNTKVIDVSDKGIESLKGIEFFTALTELNCRSNELTSLDVSKNTALTELDCAKNQITSLNVSKNTMLTDLSCSRNQLTSLDTSKNIALTNLWCFNNQLTSLNLNKNTLLTQLVCSDNKLTSLDVSRNTALTDIECNNNQLTSLDVSQNPELYILECDQNQLTSLDLSQNPALYSLYCSYNRLTSLDISRNLRLTNFSCFGNSYALSNVSLNRLNKYGFDGALTSNWQDAAYDAEANSLADVTSDTVTYDYYVGRNKTVSFSFDTDKIINPDPTKPIITVKPANGGANVTWEKVDGAINYRVFISIPGQKIRQFGSDTTGTSMTVKGLNGGQETGIIVLAQFANKKWSTYTEDDIVYVTPRDAVKPYLCVKPKGDGNHYLIWSSVPTSVRYKVMAREKGTDSWELIGATRQRCRITVQLDPDKEYEFLVRGLNSRGKYTPMDADDIVCG